jgi:hypothetical protein
MPNQPFRGRARQFKPVPAPLPGRLAREIPGDTLIVGIPIETAILGAGAGADPLGPIRNGLGLRMVLNVTLTAEPLPGARRARGRGGQGGPPPVRLYLGVPSRVRARSGRKGLSVAAPVPGALPVPAGALNRRGISTLVSAFRERNCVSRKVLASWAGVCDNTVRNIELGRECLSMTVNRVLRAMGYRSEPCGSPLTLTGESGMALTGDPGMALPGDPGMARPGGDCMARPGGSPLLLPDGPGMALASGSGAQPGAPGLAPPPGPNEGLTGF